MQAKKLHVEDYANDITSGLVPFDELAILVVARMYHIHIGVVLRDRVWYTSSAEKPDEIAFHLLFHGGVHYLDSCTGNWGYASPSHAVTVDITESSQAQLMSLVMVHKENENPAKNPLPTTPLNLSQPTSTIDQKLDELQRELDQKLDNLKGELDLKTDKEEEEEEIRSEYGVYQFKYIIQKTLQEVFFNGFTLPKYIRKQQKEAKKMFLKNITESSRQ